MDFKAAVGVVLNAQKIIKDTAPNSVI
jgi:hypothetical protein